ncbi:endonuclease domain-containing protein [Sphingoaurantiacus capsulatus]|uniref:Endonuclease domain-containing protein n=1 Tax=Sphingoaurantiacus capsulatus TaxID=1771310 RepID=A0ABV7XB49_9SPHN
MSPPEVVLWQQLRGRPHGFKFRRQHPAGPFVADFFCAEAKLAVEVDGSGHEAGDQPAHDARRDAFFASHGVKVLRISALDVMHDIEAALRTVISEASARCPLHHAPHGPPPPVGEDEVGAAAILPGTGRGTAAGGGGVAARAARMQARG